MNYFKPPHIDTEKFAELKKNGFVKHSHLNTFENLLKQCYKLSIYFLINIIVALIFARLEFNNPLGDENTFYNFFFYISLTSLFVIDIFLSFTFTDKFLKFLTNFLFYSRLYEKQLQKELFLQTNYSKFERHLGTNYDFGVLNKMKYITPIIYLFGSIPIFVLSPIIIISGIFLVFYKKANHKLRTKIKIGFISLLAISILITIHSINDRKKTEWGLAKSINTKVGYEFYKQQNPDSEYLDSIPVLIKRIPEDSLFEECLLKGTIKQYTDYIEKYPNGLYLKRAQNYKETLQAKRNENFRNVRIDTVLIITHRKTNTKIIELVTDFFESNGIEVVFDKNKKNYDAVLDLGKIKTKIYGHYYNNVLDFFRPTYYYHCCGLQLDYKMSFKTNEKKLIEKYSGFIGKKKSPEKIYNYKTKESILSEGLDSIYIPKLYNFLYETFGMVYMYNYIRKSNYTYDFYDNDEIIQNLEINEQTFTNNPVFLSTLINLHDSISEPATRFFERLLSNEKYKEIIQQQSIFTAYKMTSNYCDDYKKRAILIKELKEYPYLSIRYKFASYGYCNDNEFERILSLSYEDLYKLPKWKLVYLLFSKYQPITREVKSVLRNNGWIPESNLEKKYFESKDNLDE